MEGPDFICTGCKTAVYQCGPVHEPPKVCSSCAAPFCNTCGFINARCHACKTDGLDVADQDPILVAMANLGQWTADPTRH